MIYRPKKVATRLGTFGEVLYALAPKSVDVILNTGLQALPRERGGARARRTRGRGGLDRGRRVRVPDAGRALVVGSRQLAVRAAQALGLGVRGRAAVARRAAERPRPESGRTSASARDDVEEPVPLERRRAAAAAARAARRRSRRSARRTPTTAPPTRTASRTATSCAPSAAASTMRPTWSRSRATSATSTALLDWCAEPRRGGDPLRRRHERRRRRRGRGRRRLRGRGRRSTSAGSTACSRSTGRRARRASRPARRGPALEDQLRPHGLTLRHFPQSFEFSTLGGWIATRAGGHFATLYTHIDDLVESLRVVTPAGDDRDAGACPARAPARARTACCSARRASSA